MNPLPYPRLIVRLIATVYTPQAIIFEGETPRGPWTLEVPIPQPEDPHNLQPGERAAILNATLAAIRKDRLRRCVLWSADERTYVEEDGITDSSLPAPSGGVLSV